MHTQDAWAPTAEMSGSRSVRGAVVAPSNTPDLLRSPTDCTGASLLGGVPPSTCTI